MKMTVTKLTALIPFLLFVIYLTPAVAVVCPSIADVYIDQRDPDTNFNYRTRIVISYHPTYGIARGLFKFDIPEEIDDSEITVATLYLSGSYHTGGGDAISVRCYALNESFSEGSDTWNTLSGGDYDTSISSPGNLPSGNDWETSFDVTGLLAGKLEKLRNNGMLMRLQNESGDSYQNIASREFVDPEDFAPYLDIEYADNTSSSTTTEPVTTSTTSIPATSTTSSINTVTTTSMISTSSITTTIITSSTTTTRKPPCTMETIYGEDSEEVVILKYVRDHVLQGTPEGRELVKLYYAWSPFIGRMIENDPELQDELKEMLDVFLDDMKASLE
jgi:hypothetical protein